MKGTRIHRARRGFTLIELMIAVAIVSVLATVAAVAYGRQVKRSRLGDMRAVSMHIAAQQEVFLGFNGRYVVAAATTFCPTTVGTSASAFDTAACGSATAWVELATRVPQNTYFQYSLLAGTPAAGDDCTAPAGLVELTQEDVCGRINDASHWWVIVARGDQDGDGVFSEFVTDSTMDGLFLERAPLE